MRLHIFQVKGLEYLLQVGHFYDGVSAHIDRAEKGNIFVHKFYEVGSLLA
jgi:hypothetical protein